MSRRTPLAAFAAVTAALAVAVPAASASAVTTAPAVATPPIAGPISRPSAHLCTMLAEQEARALSAGDMALATLFSTTFMDDGCGGAAV